MSKIQKSFNDDLLFKVLEKICGYQVTQCISIACKLDIPELLEKPIFYKDLAKMLNLDQNALLRLLRVLKVEKLIKEPKPGIFINTKSGNLLSANNEYSLKYISIMHGSNFYWNCWQNAIESIKHGKAASYYAFNTDSFSYFQDNIEEFNLFNLSMENWSSLDTKYLPHLYDFSKFNLIVDIGGGTGDILHAILDVNTEAKGILYDLAQPIATAKSKFKSKKILNNLKFEVGNFIQHVPIDGDCYILRHILHDWDDDIAIRILKNCRKAIKKLGKILVIETILDTTKALHCKRDMHMLVSFSGGKEKSLEEYVKIYESAGCRLERLISLPSKLSIMELVIQ